MAYVGIFTEPGDYHAAAISWGIRERGHRCELVILSDLPQKATISWSTSSDQQNSVFSDVFGAQVQLHEMDRCWLRRPNPAILPIGIHLGDVAPAEEAWSCLQRGLIGSLSAGRFCVNAAAANDVGRRKIHQLDVARKVGLNVPNTLITNDGEAAREFANANTRSGKKTVIKGLSSPLWELDDGGFAVLETANINASQIHDDELRIAPCIFQTEIPKAFEVRATVMGKSIFAAQLKSQQVAGASLDYRQAANWANLGCESIEVPEAVAILIFDFQNHLGLNFGTMDFIVDVDGKWTFLETNPQGQFLWIEDANPKIPLLDAFTNFLIQGNEAFIYKPGGTAELSLRKFKSSNAGHIDDVLFKEKEKHVRRPNATVAEPALNLR
jgi:hypothetical protein